MALSPLDRMFLSSAALRGCPCGKKKWSSGNHTMMSVVIQLASIGNKRRVRARAVTIHLCDTCVRLIHTKTGRALRKALADAVQVQAVDISRQLKEPHGTKV